MQIIFNFQKNLYSQSWEETWDEVPVVAVQNNCDSAYIENLIQANLKTLNQFFPVLLKSSRRTNTFYFVKITEGIRFDSLVSKRRIWLLPQVLGVSRKIGEKLAAFHASRMVIPRNRYHFEDEFQDRLNVVKGEGIVPLAALDRLVAYKQHFVSKYPRLLVHHDFTPWNIFVKNRDIIFIDFFDSRSGFFYEDISKFLVATENLSANPLIQSVLKAVCANFLAGYSSIRVVNQVALKKMTAIYLMFHISYRILDGKTHTPNFRNIVKQLLKLTPNI